MIQTIGGRMRQRHVVSRKSRMGIKPKSSLITGITKTEVNMDSFLENP